MPEPPLSSDRFHESEGLLAVRIACAARPVGASGGVTSTDAVVAAEGTLWLPAPSTATTS